MKKIRTKVPVILDAQAGDTGIVAITIREFSFRGDSATVHLSYNEQVENEFAQIGELKYNYSKPIPVKGNGSANQKKILLNETELEGLWQLLNSSISSSNPFCSQLSNMIVSGTMLRMVSDKNYRKVSESNQISELTIDDWEVIDELEVVTQ